MSSGCYSGIDYTAVSLKRGKYVVAHVTMCTYQHDTALHLTEFNVIDEDDYRKGYGSALLALVLAQFKGTIKLQVLPDNTAAINLYKKYGFTFNGESERKTLIMIKENV